MVTATKKPVARKSTAAAATASAANAAAVASPAPTPVAAADAGKVKKPKLVRDSFTIPKTEYTVIDELKLRAAKLSLPAKKSELIRAGIKALAAMSEASFAKALKAVPAIKTGRPKA